MNNRVYNFAAGPATLPVEVIKEVQEELLNYNNTGMSVLEMTHRGKDFEKILEDAKNDLRELLNIPNNYQILFLQGGGHTQFAMIPLNLMKNKKADYIVTGQWSKKAYLEACIYGDASIVATSEDKNYSYIPDCSDLSIREDADYVYICENNTIFGTRFNKLPNTKDKILVSDQSSCFLSAPVDVSKYGLIFAGAQKNIGPAGVVVVIIREDLIGECLPYTPTMLKYSIHSKNNSLYNTPPCFNIYFCGKVFKWLKDNGGLEKAKERNDKKAKLLYDFLDQSKLFIPTVSKDSRSNMNITFVTKSEEEDKKFIAAATAKGFVNLKGHRVVGGMRASLYNAMTYDGVEELVKFMKEYEKEYYEKI